MGASESPTVSVILPTYNRASFLPAAFEAMLAQRVPSLEIIVGDDGSRDATKDVIETLSRDCPFPVKYVYQANEGAYGARNRGLSLVTGEYVAFYDSDDIWLPHHLDTCVKALDGNPDVDWVYGACELVELGSQQLIAPSSFYEHGKPRPFMALQTETRDGGIRVITDSDVIQRHIT